MAMVALTRRHRHAGKWIVAIATLAIAGACIMRVVDSRSDECSSVSEFAPTFTVPFSSRAAARHPRLARSAQKMPNIGDVMGAMPKIMEKMPQMMEGVKRMKEMQEKLKTQPITGSSLNGKIKLTYTATLQPLGVDIHPSLLPDMDSAALNQAVFDAMKDAHEQSLKIASQQLTDIYGSMGLSGVPGMPDTPPGMDAVVSTPPAKATPPPEPMPFDPLAEAGIMAVD